MFLVLNIAALTVFAVSGALTSDVLTTALWSAPALLVGGWAGYRIRLRLPAAAVRRLVLLLLTVAGVTAVVTGL